MKRDLLKCKGATANGFLHGRFVRWFYGVVFTAILIFCGCSGFTTDWANDNASEAPTINPPAMPLNNLDSAFNASEKHVSYPMQVACDSNDLNVGTITFDGGNDVYTWIDGWFDSQTQKIRFAFDGDTLVLTFTRKGRPENEAVDERSFAFVGGNPGVLEGIWVSKDFALYIKFETDTMTVAF